MSYQKPHDPMAKILIAVASIVLLGAVAVLVTNLSTTIQRNSSAANISKATTNSTDAKSQEASASDTETLKKENIAESNADSKEDKTTNETAEPISKLASAINDNIRPIGSADASAKSATSSARSGEEIFNGVCTACHTTGVLEAPKFGDKAAWEPRMANGFDALLTSALNGKGNMPAKGGDASLSDDEMKAAIIYMLEKAGIDAGVSAAPAAAAPAPAEDTPTEDAAAPEATTTEGETATTTTEAPATTTATDTTPSATAAKSATPATPAIAPTAATAEGSVPTAPTVSTTPTAPTAPTVSTTPTAPEASTAPAVSTPVQADNAAAAKKLYKTVCFTCHDAGVAGAPIVGNKELWAPRIAQGKEAMYHTSLNGKGAMPPKGGNPSLDDDLVKATVDYMVGLSQ